MHIIAKGPVNVRFFDVLMQIIIKGPANLKLILANGAMNVRFFEVSEVAVAAAAAAVAGPRLGSVSRPSAPPPPL